MNQRQRKKFIFAALIGVAILAAAETRADNAHATTRPGTKPNIILILADDLGDGSLGCYGSAEVKSPKIDRLAASGVRLTDFHSNGAMCSPRTR